MTPTHIVVHCSDLEFGTTEGIRRYHTETKGWKDIGYHYVIENGRASSKNIIRVSGDGKIECGRDERTDGAHSRGMNSVALGVCLVGKDKFSKNQLASLYCLLASLCYRWQIPVEQVIGHNETRYEQDKLPETRKSCPNLNMERVRQKLQLLLGFLRGQMLANGEHIKR